MGRNGGLSLPSGFVADLARAGSTQEVLAVVARWLPQIVEAERSSVSLVDDDHHLQLQAFGGSVSLTYSGRIPIEGSLIGRAFLAGETVKIHDLRRYEASDVPLLVEAGLRSAVCAPMITAGTKLGTINLASSQVGFFDDGDVQVLSSIADLIATFIAVNQHAEEYERRANTDTLTGLMSRSAALAELDRAFDDGDHRPSVLYIDVNGFKAVNDAHGHPVGDRFLKILASRIEGLTRPGDAVGRLGGDEFLVVLHRDRSAEAATKLATRITDALRHPIRIGSLVLDAGVSIGVASVRTLSDTPEDLLYDADQTMYSAKVTGAPSALVSPTIRHRSTLRIAADRDLDDAMAAADIGFHYQPVREIRSNMVVGAEALVRWDHPEHGAVPAPTLIERVEATGRTDAFTRWSLATLLRQWRSVREDLPWFEGNTVGINLTPRQLSWPGLADFLLQTLADNGLRTDEIIVEVVESSGINAGDKAERSLTRIGEAGVLIALDDFGSGHNVLSYFARFPIHCIKFDRSLVRATVDHESARRILRGLNSLALDLGVLTVAEGVESKAEADLCMEAGITIGQGWYFGYPEPLADFVDMARAEGPPAFDASADAF